MNHNTTPVHCDSCGKYFERAQPFDDSVPLWGTRFELHGGYAEFMDYNGQIPSSFELKLCHDCTLPLFRMIMGSEKYAHLKMGYFESSHAYDENEQQCCEYGYSSVE